MYRVYCDDYLLYDPRIAELVITNAKLELELNKSGSFKFKIYDNHPYFTMLKRLKSIIKVYNDGYLMFRGRILDDESGFYNEKQIDCEGELAFLVDSVQRPFEYQGDITGLLTQFLTAHNSQVDTDKQFKVGDITVTDPNNYINRSSIEHLTTWEAVKTRLLDTLGGYLFVRHETDGNYLDYLADFNVLSNQKVEFGKNMIDINKIVKGADIATAIIPLGAKTDDVRLTIADVNGGVDYVYNQNAVDLYGWIVKVVTWDDVTVPSNLLTKANAYLADVVNLLVSINLDAADLSSIDADVNNFRLGTKVQVSSTPHALNQYFLVNKLSIDIQNPAANKLRLGKTYTTLTEQNQANIADTKVYVDTQLNEQIRSVITELTTQLNSRLVQTETSILSQVTEAVYTKNDVNSLISEVNTTITQNKDSVDFRFTQFLQDLTDLQSGTDAKFINIEKYIRFESGDIVLGEVGNQITLRIENDIIKFLQNGAVVAYFSNNKLYVTDIEVTNSLLLGKFAFLPRANGNTSFKKVGT